MDQAAVQKQIEFVLIYRYQGERFDRLIKLRKQPPGEIQRVVLEASRDSVVNDEVHV